MKFFESDFSDISTDQLAAVDLLCGEYESKRTQGADVAIETFLQSAAEEIRTPLKLELIQIEMEILDAWDQLHSPEAMIQRFPEHEELIQQCWNTLRQRSRQQLSSDANKDTQALKTTTESTHVVKSESQLARTDWDAFSVADDPSSRFRIIRNLAQGGIGTVFVAFDRDLQREVAIKELKRKFSNDRQVVERFEAEATVTGNLEHPNIVPIYATGMRSDGRPYYAMRLIHGRSMQAAIAELHRDHSFDSDLRKNAAARDLILRLVTVCKAVGFAHSRGVLHRDLKPSNIMVGEFGETLVVDWGLAKRLGLTVDQFAQSHRAKPNSANEIEGTTDRAKSLITNKTLDGTIIGTPGFMSPEQANGSTEDLTIASDIYSLGATLFQILANTIPTRTNENRFEQLDAINAPLVAICRQAMQINPSQRYASAELLAADLESWLLDEPVSVLPESRLKKFRRWAKAHPALVASGLASLLFTMLAMAITLSILSVKNENLRQSNLREQAAALEATQNAEEAKRNGDEAIRQRQRVLGILNTFLVNVERGLNNVPGGAAVQKNVLTTVLNKLAEVSQEFADDREVSLANAMALIDLGDLFSRVGTKDITLDLPQRNQVPVSPLEAAGEMYAEAMKIATQLEAKEGKDCRSIIAKIQQKQAEVLRQTARTPEAVKLLDQALATRRTLFAESPKSAEAAMDVVTTVDYMGQIHMQDGNIKNAGVAFAEIKTILTKLSQESPDDPDIKRRLGITLSRIADIAVHDGNLDEAEELYEEDLVIATELYQASPNNLTAKRDLCTSLDRIGNTFAQKGQLEKSMDYYLKSRQMREELYAAEPTSMKAIQDLLVSYFKGGDTQMLLKDVPHAQKDYERALLLSDEMARIDPENAVARRFQSLSAEVLADVAIEQSQLDAALKYANRSLTISQKLVSKDPTDGQMQRDLWLCYAKVAKVYQAREEFDNCLAQLDLALKIVLAEFERHPESLQAQGDYSFVLLKRAEAQLEAGHAALAARELEQVIPLLESVPEENRKDAKSRRRLANAITMSGRAYLASGEPQKAKNALERSRQMTVAMIDEGMRVEQMTIDLSEIDELISSIEKP